MRFRRCLLLPRREKVSESELELRGLSGGLQRRLSGPEVFKDEFELVVEDDDDGNDGARSAWDVD